MTGDKILQIRDLRVSFDTPSGIADAVDGVSFDVRRGESFGIVGQSGSGKTLTALSILKLITPPGRIVSGSAVFNGEDLMAADEDSLRRTRGAGISMVFQEPATAFNPVFTVGYQVAEAVRAHQAVDGRKAKDIALEFLKRVHIAEALKVYHDYPHQLSGGTKQRAMIAMALVNSPELLILDEPTTALDVTIQAQILDLLEEIRKEARLSILFISHDFGVISRMCDRVAVMHKGRIVETGATKDVLSSPEEDYTLELLESVRALG
jgi:ABC-type dipeptide/oligopeptide/nickel transport system ATPase component